MKRFIALRMLILTMLAVVVLFVGTVMLVETIVSIHTISTNESPGFVEEKFASLKVGMTVNETVALLGRPLSQESRGDGRQEFWYTQSKEPLNGWGTWDARILVISNDAIAEIISRRLPNH